MIYIYKVKRRHLTDTEKVCLMGMDDVVSQHSPRQLKKFYCADFQFPNGDTFSLEPKAVHLDSADAIE
ncbi:hypothetical protein [Geobacter sulfurreducens]|uniref:hypothetical protein n=1 Tax=Geobacter sulfurreducens TaxID=35554 RepID=UPI000DBADE58|nr:hypothetical protein [Geobacter sulfurreducens]BBA70612.1 hypothetical protein YM18_2093 [Geobacter sulfurreducens]